MMPTVLVRMCTDSFLTDVKEPNPRRAAARNTRQTKVINWAKSVRLVLNSKK